MPKEVHKQSEEVDIQELIDRPDICKFIGGCTDSELLAEIANVAYNMADDAIDDALYENKFLNLDFKLEYATKYFTTNYKRLIQIIEKVFKKGVPSKAAQLFVIRKSSNLDKLSQLKGAADLAKTFKKKKKYLAGAQLLIGGLVWKAIKRNSKTARNGEKRFDKAISSEEGARKEAENLYDFLSDFLHTQIPLFPKD